jgi:hypothetical protein
MSMIFEATKVLEDCILPNGKFIYALDAKGNKIKGYNWLRHYGALWVLTGGLKKHYRYNAAKAAHAKAINYANRNVYDDTGACVLKAWKSGLIGISILPQINMGLIDNVSKMLLHLEGYQKKNGTFMHKVVDGKETSFVSNYYTGEIMFGLCDILREHRLTNVMPVYKNFKGEEAILKASTAALAEKLLAPLEKWVYKNEYGVKIQSHWMMYALQCQHGLQRNAEKAINLATLIIEEIIKNKEYRERMESTPIACRLEAAGLFRLMVHLSKMRHPGHVIAYPEGFEKHFNKDVAIVTSLFNKGYFLKGKRSNEWRIDYNQHAIAGLSLYTEKHS